MIKHQHPFESWVLELREILRESKNSLYFVDLDSWVQFNSAVACIRVFFPPREVDKTLRLPNLEYPIFTEFTEKSIFHDQGCSPFCSYLSY